MVRDEPTLPDDVGNAPSASSHRSGRHGQHCGSDLLQPWRVKNLYRRRRGHGPESSVAWDLRRHLIEATISPPALMPEDRPGWNVGGFRLQASGLGESSLYTLPAA
jgi:hypothetical protein